MDASITSKVADEIIKRREEANAGGPFKDPNDFWSFVSSQGVRIDSNKQKMIPILTDTVYNFRITSTGSYKNTTSEIVAVVFDVAKSASQSYTLLKTEVSSSIPGSGSSSGAGTSQPNSKNSNNSASKGPPRIVYWYER